MNGYASGIPERLALHEQRKVFGDRPRYLLMMLHGLGTNGADLLPLSDWIRGVFEASGGVVVVAPNAPDNAFGMTVDSGQYQWFDFVDPHIAPPTPTAEAIVRGVRGAAEPLREYIEQCLQRYNIDSQNTFLLGFSQGAMMALHVGLRLRRPLAGVIAIAGLLADQGDVYAQITSHPPVLLAHGEADPVVPVDAARTSETMLKRLDVSVTSLFVPELGHTIDATIVRAILRFVGQHLVEEQKSQKTGRKSVRRRMEDPDSVVIPQVGLSGQKPRKSSQEGGTGDSGKPDRSKPKAPRSEEKPRDALRGEASESPKIRSAPLTSPLVDASSTSRSRSRSAPDRS